MPLYKVNGHTRVNWELEVEADSADAAEAIAIGEVQTPYIDDGYDWEDPEVDGEPVRIAEDGEDPDGDR